MNYLDEAQFEIVTMDYLRVIVYGSTFGLDISLQRLICEHTDYVQVVLIGKFQTALENINSNISPDAEKFVEPACAGTADREPGL